MNSVDSGPNSEFRFNDIDAEKQRKKVIIKPVDQSKLEVTEAIRDTDSQRVSIKRKMTLSSKARGTQGNQKILNAAGIPRPLLKNAITFQEKNLDAADIMQAQNEKQMHGSEVPDMNPNIDLVSETGKKRIIRIDKNKIKLVKSLKEELGIDAKAEEKVVQQSTEGSDTADQMKREIESLQKKHTM